MARRGPVGSRWTGRLLDLYAALVLLYLFLPIFVIVSYSFNKPDDFILAMVEFVDGASHKVRCLRRPFSQEPEFGVTSINYDFAELLERAGAPS